MKKLHSVVMGLDGESKCGKTTIINAAAKEAKFQADLLRNMINPETWTGKLFNAEDKQGLRTLHDQTTFRNITPISAGNVFRGGCSVYNGAEAAWQYPNKF